MKRAELRTARRTVQPVPLSDFLRRHRALKKAVIENLPRLKLSRKSASGLRFRRLWGSMDQTGSVVQGRVVRDRELAGSPAGFRPDTQQLLADCPAKSMQEDLKRRIADVHS